MSSVNYLKVVEPKSEEPNTETKPKLALVPPVTVDVAVDELDPAPGPIFCALLSGDVSSRGISWYNTTQSNLDHRVSLLKKVAKEIERAYARQNTTH